MAKKEELTEKDIVVAKTPDEAMWMRTTDGLKADIENMEKSLKVSKAFLEKAEEILAALRSY